MIDINALKPPEEFNEKNYLDCNHDVAQAVARGEFVSGWEHFYKYGFSENRDGVPAHLRQLLADDYLEYSSLIPPDYLHSVGLGDFISVGRELFALLLNRGGLKPEHRILDVGCGTGRVACFLTKYLTSGTYDGFDIVEPSINWCQENYRENYPNFHFHFSDIYNKMYNTSGKYRADEYKFPFESDSFDFIFLTSVFTHMLPLDMENYLAEVSRVLVEGGTCFITYFLLNEEAEQLITNGISKFSFGYQLEGCRVENGQMPENAVAYQEEKIRQLYLSNGLEIVEPIEYGKWSGRKKNLSYQDLILAQKNSTK